MAIEQAPTIARLVEVASRLRMVRRAQRRFLRRWAQDRSDRWLEAIVASDASQFSAPRFRRRFGHEQQD